MSLSVTSGPKIGQKHNLTKHYTTRVIQVESAASVRKQWNLLYQVGGVAALLTAIIIPVQVVAFLLWPPPIGQSVGEWYALFQTNRLIGLVHLDLLLVVDLVLGIPLTLAVYIALQRTNASVMLLAAALSLLSTVMYFATNPSIEILALSARFADASEADRALLFAAGESLLASWQGIGFHIAYLAGSIAGIAFGAVMLQSRLFSKGTGYMGIAANAVGLGLYIPVVGLYISVFSVLFLEVWYVLVGRRLLLLGRDK